jgi:hypothetical protein
MLPSFARQGAPIRSFHPSTYALAVVTFLSLSFILAPSWISKRDSSLDRHATPHEENFTKATTNRLYPQVVVLGDSIAERSFDEAEGYGIKLTSMVSAVAGLLCINSEHLASSESQYAGKMDVLNRGFGG